MSAESDPHPIFARWENVLDAAVGAIGSTGEGLAEPTARASVEALLHFQRTWEEQVLHPRLARYFVGGGPVPVMEAEHRDLERRWYRLDVSDARNREDFARALRLHVRKESLSLVQVARLRLSRREWEALAEVAAAQGLALPQADL
ncbi:MAG: hemerythrin domain-containing protein [Clostridia bacterium]